MAGGTKVHAMPMDAGVPQFRCRGRDTAHWASSAEARELFVTTGQETRGDALAVLFRRLLVVLVVSVVPVVLVVSIVSIVQLVSIVSTVSIVSISVNSVNSIN